MKLVRTAIEDQKIAAFGSSYAPVGAAEGCDLLICCREAA
jgi:hypothetical protein